MSVAIVSFFQIGFLSVIRTLIPPPQKKSRWLVPSVGYRPSPGPYLLLIVVGRGAWETRLRPNVYHHPCLGRPSPRLTLMFFLFFLFPSVHLVCGNHAEGMKGLLCQSWRVCSSLLALFTTILTCNAVKTLTSSISWLLIHFNTSRYYYTPWCCMSFEISPCLQRPLMTLDVDAAENFQ